MKNLIDSIQEKLIINKNSKIKSHNIKTINDFIKLYNLNHISDVKSQTFANDFITSYYKHDNKDLYKTWQTYINKTFSEINNYSSTMNNDYFYDSDYYICINRQGQEKKEIAVAIRTENDNDYNPRLYLRICIGKTYVVIVDARDKNDNRNDEMEETIIKAIEYLIKDMNEEAN